MLFAASADAATRRLRADRVHLAHDGGTARLTLAGVRLGEDAIDTDAVPMALREHWRELFAGPLRVLVDLTALVGPGVPDLAKRLQAAVATQSILDGVRIDPGAEFGTDGSLLPAGVQPGLTAAGEKALAATYQSVLRELIDKRDAASPRYERLAAGAVSSKRLGVVATGKGLAELRTGAADTPAHARLGRVYFAADGALALDAAAVSRADAAKVYAKFKDLAAKHLPPEPNGEPFARVAAPAADAPTFGASLSAALRAEIAADAKTWSGVLIERNYFDADGRFAFRGVVDRAGQNAELAKRLDALKADPKWAGYFAVAPNPPALDVVPLAALVERVKRVTPAHPAFDGVRVESARYDAAGDLIFNATTTVKLEPEPAALLAKLIRDHPTYRRRAPADRQVKIVSTGTAPEVEERSEVTAGAKLLEGADAKKARAWLDGALLHHPTDSAVWFLSAYDHHARGDAELVRRDLSRAIALEPRGSAGDALRRRRYDATKNLQGKERTELEALWAECVRELKDGAKPTTLTK